MGGKPEYISLDIDALLASIDLQVDSIAPELNEVLTQEDALDVAQEIVAKTVEVELVPEPVNIEVADAPAVEVIVTNPPTSAHKPSSRPRRTRHADYGSEQRSRKNIDRDDIDIIKLYLADIGKYPLLTKDDEVRLSKKIEAGVKARQQQEAAELTDTRMSPSERHQIRRTIHEADQATDEFTKSNLRLVVSIAKRYQASGLPLMDLIQEGNLGLMHAVEMFDWQKGFKFSTYATWWIRQAITRGIANTGNMIRLPVHAGDSVSRLKKARHHLRLDGYEATVEQLAVELEISVEEVKKLHEVESRLNPTSLNAPLREDSDAEFGDIVADTSVKDDYDRADVAGDLVDRIADMLTCLDAREQELLQQRYGLNGGEPKTLEEVGVHFGLTRERIRQIEARAISKLRHPALAARHRELIHYLFSEAS